MGRGSAHSMAHIRSDIPYGYDDTSQVGFWTPETPEFLEKRDARRAAQYGTVTSYAQAKATIRRVSIANQEASAKAWGEREGQARIVDFGELERARRTAAPSRSTWGFSRDSEYGHRFDDRSRGYAGSFDGGYEPSREYRVEAGVRRSRQPQGATGSRNGRRGDRASSFDFRAEFSVRRPARYSDGYGAAGYADEYDVYDEVEEFDENETGNTLLGRLRKARHDRRKRKADRAFSREYADAAPADEGPRAAVYRGKMGRQHQRATRMQAQGSQSSLQMPAFLTGIIEALSLDRIVFRPWFAVTAVTLFCVVIVANGVYPAVQDYYLQMRANDQLAAEYEAVVDRNAELQNHVEALQTDEGMEELAHESLGWVREGENSVSVLMEGSAEPGTGVIANTEAIVEGSVPAPETWYSPVLDAVFGYKG